MLQINGLDILNLKSQGREVEEVKKSIETTPLKFDDEEDESCMVTAEEKMDVNCPSTKSEAVNHIIKPAVVMVPTCCETTALEPDQYSAKDDLGLPSKQAIITNATNSVNSDREVGRNGAIAILSVVYGKVLVIFGLVFPMAQVLAKDVPPDYFQFFYIYLFAGCLSFHVFVNLDSLLTKIKLKWQLRRKRLKSSSTDNIVDGESGGGGQSYVDPEMFKLPKPLHSYGSFYLRIGQVLFGVGSLMYAGIEAAMFVEMSLVDTLELCEDDIPVSRAFLQMIFIFTQMYFVFTNHKLNIYKHKNLAHFGLMHMIATNLCIWLHVVIMETNHEIMLAHHLKEHDLSKNLDLVENKTSHKTQVANEGLPCHRHGGIMTKLLNESGQFLFPCMIEHSLICAAVLTVMWSNVTNEHQHFINLTKVRSTSRRYYSVSRLRKATTVAGTWPLRPFPMERSSKMHPSCESSRRMANYYSVDCSHATSGLFSGLLVMAMVLISLVVFFTLKREKLLEPATEIAQYSQLVLYSISLVAVILGMIQVRKLDFDMAKRPSLDNYLLFVAQTGVLVYSVFIIIGTFFRLDTKLIDFATSLVYITQTIMQTMFIMTASRRYARTVTQAKSKPGRELVTFLLVANLAMWAVNSLETSRADLTDFYGNDWSWPIIEAVSMPLAIYYRFHSTVCLCEIWKKSYKHRSFEIMMASEVNINI